MINRELIRLKIVQLVYAFYQNEGKTLDTAEKELAFSLSKAYDLYQYLLLLLTEIRRVAERKDDARKKRITKSTTNTIAGAFPEQKLAENKFLLQLSENIQLLQYAEHQKKNWEAEESLIKNLYTCFTESEVFELYLTKEDFSYEADREVIRKLYKTFVCNNESFDSMLEEHSLYWNDDKEIVDSFVLKTIKRFKEEEGEHQALLPEFASEDDKNFATTLFRATLEREEDVRDLIKSNSKNWEFSRLAFMDVIIMQIALTEILTFPTIPLSVTFNEYLDIAKVYSTPKSASYINGTLDHIVKRLKTEHKILK